MASELTELTAPVFSRSREIYGIGEGTQEPQGLGVLEYREYEKDRRLRVPVFHPANKPDKTVVLGRASRQFSVIDPYAAAEPLFNAGLEPRSMHYFRDNTQLLAFFTMPGSEMLDSIGWDDWAENDGAQHSMFAVQMRMSMHLGNAIRYTLGVFRQVCVNGLVVERLGLGHMSFRHLTTGDSDEVGFRPEMVEDWLNERAKKLAEVRDQITNPPTIKSKALGWAVDIFDKLAEDEKGENRGELLNSLPVFASRPIRTMLERMPRWSVPVMADQLHRLYDNGTVSAMDILNALTNVADKSPRERRAWEIYRRLDPLYSATKDLVDVSAFRADLEPLPETILN